MFRAIRLAEILFTWAILSPLFSLQWINELNQWHIWVTAKCEYSYDQFCFNRAEIYINVRNPNKNEIKLAIRQLTYFITTDLKWKVNLKS